ncbi:hypothetical protein SAMN02910292_02544 [Lachnospiraceae bacterium XBB2008]|nr:hypothetical protein SAMN02910292_02544 [Lachnospiraceae bacterium XBB2008]
MSIIWGIILFFLVVGLAFIGGIWLSAILGVFLLFRARKDYRKFAKSCTFTPTPVGCPACGSKNIQVQNIMTGSNTSAYTFTKGLLKGSTTARTHNSYEKRGYCTNCGNDYLIITADALRNLKASLYKRYRFDLIWGIILTSIGGIGIIYLIITAATNT